MARVDIIGHERLLDDRHHAHELHEFWTDHPVVLTFLPQFGNAFAQRQVDDLRTRQADLDALGAQVVAVGLGTPIQAFTFRKRTGARFPILTTHDRTLYRTMGLSRTWIGAYGPATLPALARTIRQGTTPHQTTGDPAQLGGVFVVAAGGTDVLWTHRAHRGDDLPDPDTIIDALQHAQLPAATPIGTAR